MEPKRSPFDIKVIRLLAVFLEVQEEAIQIFTVSEEKEGLERRFTLEIWISEPESRASILIVAQEDDCELHITGLQLLSHY